MKKKIIALALLLAIGGGIWFASQPQQHAGHLTLYGNVDLRQVSLAFNASGRITQLSAQEGDTVDLGQAIGQLDTRSLQLSIAITKAQIEVQREALRKLENGSRAEDISQARSEVAAVQANLEYANQRLARIQKTGKAMSQQDLDAATNAQKIAVAQLSIRQDALTLALAGPREEDIAVARAQMQAAEAQLALLEYQLSEATLIAPIQATVRTRILEPGDMASPQTAVYTLAITDPKWVRAYITEADLAHIHEGMSAEILIDSFLEQPIAGRIGFISSVAEFTPKYVQTEELRTSLVYEIRVFVDDPQNRLRLGMPATVKIRNSKF